MQRLAIALLAIGLLSASGTSTVAQEPSAEELPRLDGRVEWYEHGFAVSVPDGWFGFDLTRDVGEQVRTLDRDASVEASLGLTENLAAMRDEGALLALLGPLDSSGSDEGCIVWVESGATRPVNQEFAQSLHERLVANESVARVEAPTWVDLPAGSGYALAMMQQSRFDEDSWRPLVSYLLVGDRGTFRVSCTASERPVDDWLSIVGALELMPIEE